MEHFGKLGAVLVAALLGTSATAALAQHDAVHQHKKMVGAVHDTLRRTQEMQRQNQQHLQKLHGDVSAAHRRMTGATEHGLNRR